MDDKDTMKETRLGRRQWLASVAAIGACALCPQTVQAGARYEYVCDWRAAFVPDPSKKQRVGYLTSLQMPKVPGLLTADLDAFCPFDGNAEYGGLKLEDQRASVAGVLEKLSWGGGVGDPICISAYISATNALKLRQKMKSGLESRSVENFGYWVASYDEEYKQWFEEAYPLDPNVLPGQINASGAKDLKLTIGSEATKPAPDLDLDLYNMSLEVMPPAGSSFALRFATGWRMKSVRNWGIKAVNGATLR